MVPMGAVRRFAEQGEMAAVKSRDSKSHRYLICCSAALPPAALALSLIILNI